MLNCQMRENQIGVARSEFRTRDNSNWDIPLIATSGQIKWQLAQLRNDNRQWWTCVYFRYQIWSNGERIGTRKLCEFQSTILLVDFAACQSACLEDHLEDVLLSVTTRSITMAIASCLTNQLNLRKKSLSLEALFFLHRPYPARVISSCYVVSTRIWQKYEDGIFYANNCEFKQLGDIQKPEKNKRVLLMNAE